MYIARIKLLLKRQYKDSYYEKSKWFDLFKYNDKECKWRIKEDGIIEIVIGIYSDRETALLDGKKLYFNVLYEIHKCSKRFYLGDLTYETKLFHEDRGYTFEEFEKNEEWFYNTKYDCADFFGLSVYQIDESIDELDNYGLDFSISSMVVRSVKPFSFLDKLNNINNNYIYSRKNQEIFNLIRLSEEADCENELVLLCQALEKMSEEKDKTLEEIEVIEQCIECVKMSNLNEDQKSTLINMLKQGKRMSKRNICKETIKKYLIEDYKEFNKMEVFKEAYKLRGMIVHGDKLKEDTDFSVNRYLKIMVLDILKEWSKKEN